MIPDMPNTHVYMCDDVLDEPGGDLRRIWEAQLSGWDSPFAWFHSQERFDMWCQPRMTNVRRPALAVACDAHGRPTGIVPVAFFIREITLRLVGNFAINLRPAVELAASFLAGRTIAPLIFKLAARNLLHDRLSFAAT